MHYIECNLKALLALMIVCMSTPAESRAQRMIDRIVSEHVRIAIPAEREWLGRDVISDIERCYLFVNGMTNEKMPRKILITVSWSEQTNRLSVEDSSIVIGMNQPAADLNPRLFIMRAAAKEMSRLSLMELSRGTIQRDEADFLIEGMAELLMREWERNTRSLAGAWMISYYLDKMNMLGFAAQASWSKFSEGRHTLRSAAPGATFLTTCRELHSRDRILKFFEALKRVGLEEALTSVFKTPASSLEAAWLQKVRAYNPAETFTATTEDEAPVLRQTVFIPAEAHPGQTLQIQFYLTDSANNLFPDGIFIQEEASGRVFQGTAPAEKGGRYVAVNVPIEAARQPGTYTYIVTAVDEAGNIRHWNNAYTVTR